MPQYAILRFAKHKGGAGALEAHHERKKEKYASNPDIDIARSKHNFHIVTPTMSYKRESDNRIEAAGCKARKDSVRFVDTLITASPDFFKGKKRDEIEELARCLLPEIQRFFRSEDGKREFEKWMAERTDNIGE